MKKCNLASASAYCIFFCFPQIFAQTFSGAFPSRRDTTNPVLYYWDASYLGFKNFGDELSAKLVERMLKIPIQTTHNPDLSNQRKILAIGSIIRSARNNDVIWGSGINGKFLAKENYFFTNLDVRAVRGPLTRDFLLELGIACPEVYGDPALLFPLFFPEFERSAAPSKNYIIIPHYSDEYLFCGLENIVSVKEEWDTVIKKILDSKFVISTSLHGIVIAEAFGIPARLLRLTENEPLFKYMDYYYGTNRKGFAFATTVEEALSMGGEKPYECDLKELYKAFPFDLWLMEPLLNVRLIIEENNIN